MTESIQYKIIQHLLVALIAGGLIGLERSYQGRPAGFRTHVLVCVSASMLMLVTLYQSVWYGVERLVVVLVPGSLRWRRSS